MADTHAQPHNEIVFASTGPQHVVQRRGHCGSRRERRVGPITAIITEITALVVAVKESREAEKQRRRGAIERDILPMMRSQLGSLRDEKEYYDEGFERYSEERRRGEQLPAYEEVFKSWG
ncbi:hypothetical protein CAC42_4025 [Sphaceloma murrayae]|uniref:Uncharacterized protein n=1 Tax=Sphaceloma murrayae TaxID=2082308 RepID=A0A2K1QSJ4_9PEZI|nr:hypothetical protein CAC42_4025 [Sphaceloma murrayae]